MIAHIWDCSVGRKLGRVVFPWTAGPTHTTVSNEQESHRLVTIWKWVVEEEVVERE